MQNNPILQMQLISRSTFLFLLGTCVTMLSCSPIEMRVKKYELHDKTIIASSVGHEVNYDYVVFSDKNGLYFDNLEDVKQIISFGKEYVTLTPIKASLQGNRINYKAGEKTIFNEQQIRCYYDVYPIGDWATLLVYNKDTEYEVPSFCIFNNSDTIYNLVFKEWCSWYNMFYKPTELIIRNSDGLDRHISGVYTTIKQKNDVGNYFSFNVTQKPSDLGDDMNINVDYFKTEMPYFYDWLNEGAGPEEKFTNTTTFISYDQQSMRSPTILSYSFDNIPNCNFTSDEIDTSGELDEAFIKIFNSLFSQCKSDFDVKWKQLKGQCTDIGEICDDLRNEYKATSKYFGKQLYLYVDAESIEQSSFFDNNKYKVYATCSNGLFNYVNAICLTDDKQFLQLDYPRTCIIKGELSIYNSSTSRIRINNCELICAYPSFVHF